ncbi:MAG TPA: Mov34/MPN/PAD-1 family protein, partial [Gemmatimonadaceae bacterium]|nr:Mov34/MPN/PAD-1 family protein [Gemmatimonadaceae bacterium]
MTGPAAGRATVAIDDAIRRAIEDAARADYPNEMCGVIVGDAPAAAGGRALRFEHARNKAASPYRYEIHPDDLLRVMLEIDDAGAVPWGIVHSHVRSPARPSPTDIE